ncbi:hypothetical protein KKE26_01285 [bacterium]|nr:hypothetical protein [bacterium]MBU1752529.1 hypothetical protein [bacterium]
MQLGFNPQITQISQITDEMGEKSERHIAVETQDIVSLQVHRTPLVVEFVLQRRASLAIIFNLR